MFITLFFGICKNECWICGMYNVITTSSDYSSLPVQLHTLRKQKSFSRADVFNFSFKNPTFLHNGSFCATVPVNWKKREIFLYPEIRFMEQLRRLFLTLFVKEALFARLSEFKFEFFAANVYRDLQVLYREIRVWGFQIYGDCG